MTEERAKEVLQEQIDKYGQEYDAEGIEALEMAIKALEQTRWIPVSERLPEEDGMYLISTCMNCIDTCLFYKDDDEYLWVDYEESVIAWMPLPESYRGDKDGNINNKE